WTTAPSPFAGCIGNRLPPRGPASLDAAHTERALAQTPSVTALGLSQTSMRIASEALVGAHVDLEVLAHADQQSIARLRHADGPGAVLVQVPFLREDVHDVARLIDLGRYLVGA